MTKQSNSDYDVEWQTNNIPLTYWCTSTIAVGYQNTVWLTILAPYGFNDKILSLSGISYYSFNGQKPGSSKAISVNDLQNARINYIHRYTNSWYISIGFDEFYPGDAWYFMRLVYDFVNPS